MSPSSGSKKGTCKKRKDEMEKEMRGGPQQRLEEGDRVRHAVREEQHCERESGVARVAARVAAYAHQVLSEPCNV